MAPAGSAPLEDEQVAGGERVILARSAHHQEITRQCNRTAKAAIRLRRRRGELEAFGHGAPAGARLHVNIYRPGIGSAVIVVQRRPQHYGVSAYGRRDPQGILLNPVRGGQLCHLLPTRSAALIDIGGPGAVIVCKGGDHCRVPVNGYSPAERGVLEGVVGDQFLLRGDGNGGASDTREQKQEQ